LIAQVPAINWSCRSCGVCQLWGAIFCGHVDENCGLIAMSFGEINNRQRWTEHMRVACNDMSHFINFASQMTLNANISSQSLDSSF
jgi:hypothetical protein